MNKIPALIFQTWKSKTDFPANFAYWSNTLREQNPTYAYRLWDDADNRAFIEGYFAWFLPTYDAYPAEIYRADAVRYFFLYQFGGIYADMDMECIRSLDPLLKSSGVVLGSMGANTNFEHSIPNAIMMSEPRQEFWLYMISTLLNPEGAAAQDRPEYITGPVALRTAYLRYHGDYQSDHVQNRIANIRARLPDDHADRQKSTIAVLPGNYLYPLDWNDPIHDTFVRKPIIRDEQYLDRDAVLRLFPNSFTVTYWSHSWEKQDD